MGYDAWKTTEPDDWHDQRIRRTCTGCGEVVRVGRDEEYTVQVFCDRCLAAPPDRVPARKDSAA